MTSTYQSLNMQQKAEYQKYNSAVNILKAMATLAVATEEDIRAAADIRPCEVYFHLTGKEIGAKYLQAITNADLSPWETTALQLAKVWQDVKMPIRKLLQWRATDKTMVQRFRAFLADF